MPKSTWKPTERENSVAGYVKMPDGGIGSARRDDPHGLPYQGPQEKAANEKKANAAFGGFDPNTDEIKRAFRIQSEVERRLKERDQKKR